MKRYLIVFISVCFLFGYPDFGLADTAISPEDFKEFATRRYVDLQLSIVTIQVIGHGLGRWTWNGEWIEGYGAFAHQGMGFVVKGNFIITAAHVVNPELVVCIQNEGFFVIAKMVKLYSKTIFVGNRITHSIPAKIEHIDVEYDLAVLSYPGNQLKPLDYPLMDARYFVWAGEPVAMIARQRLESGKQGPWYEVRTGKIVSSTPETPDSDLPWFNMLDFTMDIKVFLGESGSPVFMKFNGKLYIVGVARAISRTQQKSYAVRLYTILPVIGGAAHESGDGRTPRGT